MNANATRAARTPITDSPWFWLYLFATAALVALMLMSSRYAARQSQIERNMQGRLRASQLRAGESPTTPLSDSSRTIIRLAPLHALMAAFLIIAWVGLLARHRRLRFGDARPVNSHRELGHATDSSNAETIHASSPL